MDLNGSLAKWLGIVGVLGGWVFTLGVLIWAASGEWAMGERDVQEALRRTKENAATISELENRAAERDKLLSEMATDLKWIKQKLSAGDYDG